MVSVLLFIHIAFDGEKSERSLGMHEKQGEDA
jgi:hypothetical protein